MSRRQHGSSCRSAAQRASRRETHNSLKSERVQLELATAQRVRKIVQRGAQGRFVPPLVLPVERPSIEIVIVLEGGSGGVEGVVVKRGGHAAETEVCDAAA